MFEKINPVITVVLLVFLFAMSGCITDTDATRINKANSLENKQEEVSAEPVIVRLEGGDWGYPQPYTRYSRGPGNALVNYIFDKLIEKDEEGFIPWLAEEWEVLDGGKVYIFHLIQSAVWHDGEPFTAEDVEFTFKYIKAFPPVSPVGMLMDDSVLLEVKALSDYQVQFTFARPDANLFEDLSTVYILPAHIWRDIEKPDEFTTPQAVIGTGPYILTDYDKEHGTYRYAAYREFWGYEPVFDFIEFIPVSDPVLALERGDIHLSGIPVDVLPRFDADPKYASVQKPGFWGYRLRFNYIGLPEMQNKELRQAFAYAIDRQELVDKTARGAAVAGSMGVLPPDHRWYNPALPKYDKDVDKAKTLLTEAGLEGQKLQYELLVGEGAEVRIGELIKENLADIGIVISVVSMDMKSRDGRIAEGKYQLALVGHGGWARDPNYLGSRFADDIGSWSSGTPGYYNAQVEKLVTQLKSEIDETKRKEITMELQWILAEDVPEISLYLTTGHDVFRNDIHDGWIHVFDHHVLTHNILSFVKR